MTVALPEINFLTTDPQIILGDVVKMYEGLEGRRLAQGDPLYIIFLSLTAVIAKQNIAINDAARQNLLYYSREGVLDHKGYGWSTPRLGNNHAVSTLRVHLSTEMNTAKVVPKGTSVTGRDGTIVFETTAEGVISPGNLITEIPIHSIIPGVIGNDFEIGEIDTLLIPISFISKVENTTMSAGGTEKEEDDSYRERIHQAPESLSVAGPEGAYKYLAKSANAGIEDVFVDSPEPGKVRVSLLMQNGEMPGEEIVNEVYEILSDKKKRPLTDLVEVGAPEVVEYDLDITYYIDSVAVNKNLVEQNIQAAIESYVKWQSERIGRDVNPSQLIALCIRAGAKRAEITSPEFRVVEDGQVAKLGSRKVVFGGVEDD